MGKGLNRRGCDNPRVLILCICQIVFFFNRINRGQFFIIQIFELVKHFRIQNANHRKNLPLHFNFSRSCIFGENTDKLGQIIWQQANELFSGFKPSPAHQIAICPGNFGFVWRKAQQRIDKTVFPRSNAHIEIDVNLLRTHIGSGLCHARKIHISALAAHLRQIPRSRHNIGAAFKSTIEIIEHGFLHPAPRSIAHECPLIRRLVIAGQFVKLQRSLH